MIINDGMRKLEIIRDSLTESATTILGYDKRRQPDWFQENIFTLKELIIKRNTLFAKRLKTHHNSDRQMVAKEVKRAKNAWFGRKAQEIESEIQKGACSKGIWKGLKEMQHRREGLQAVKPKSIRKQDGKLCMDSIETLQQWHDHFRSVLNIRSSFEPSSIQSVYQYPVKEEMSESPTERMKC